VLARIMLCLGFIAAAASIANSQSPAVSNLPEPCRAGAPMALPKLEKRKERLEREIAKSGKRDDAEAKTLSKSRQELLQVLFQIECAKLRGRAAAVPPPPPRATPVTRTAPAPQPVPASAPRPETTSASRPDPAPPSRAVRTVTKAAPKSASKNAVEVVAYYATNRGRSDKSDAAKAYDAAVSPLSYGRAVVSIPAIHASGSLELPSIWRLELRPNSARHFILKSAAALGVDEARSEMVKSLQASRSKALLVFVHGYNMSFAETAMRAAQLAYDLDFPGLPFFFSWPSAGTITGYLRDLETAQLSEAAFDQVLDDLAQLPVGEVYIIAHSMGSRLVSQVLRSRVDKGKATAGLKELLLAAPDINADLFRTVIAPRLKAMQGVETTVYASSSDLALRASKAVHGYRRVGETAEGVFVYPGLETIDASRASFSVRAFGHSYLTDSAAVLKDIRSLLRQKLKARQRGLAEAGTSPNIYWSLK
jgi:esterase/lipase superfamily enzyme